MIEPQLDGALAIVTGCGGRLGPVWVRALHESGLVVAGIDLVADDPPAGLAELVVADVLDRDGVERAVEGLVERFGPPRVLVNNAGIDQPPTPGVGGSALVQEVPLDKFRRVLEVNVGGAFNVCQVVGPRMVAEGAGSIVNIGSLYATTTPDPALYEHIDPPFLKPPAYGASKAALLSLTRYLARLWGPHGVRVNALSPGGVLGGQDPLFIEKFSARVALGRLAEQDDLVGPLLFLAGPASRYVTGQELRVDGGFSA